jgi:hypothetical protein
LSVRKQGKRRGEWGKGKRKKGLSPVPAAQLLPIPHAKTQRTPREEGRGKREKGRGYQTPKKSD